MRTLGALEEAKRALIESLKQEGALDRPRIPLPGMPKHVAIVTGAGSAALSDMKRLISNRWPGFENNGDWRVGFKATEPSMKSSVDLR